MVQAENIYLDTDKNEDNINPTINFIYDQDNIRYRLGNNPTNADLKKLSEYRLVVEQDDDNNNFFKIVQIIKTKKGKSIKDTEYSRIIFKNDNVGIGIDDPQTKLHISGTLLITGKDSAIGIGINEPPRAKLHVSGSIIIGKTKKQNNYPGRLYYDNETNLFYYTAKGKDSSKAISRDITGNAGWELNNDMLYSTPNIKKIGLGTKNPLQKLHINDGNLLLTGVNSSLGIGVLYPSGRLHIKSTKENEVDNAILDGVKLYLLNDSKITNEFPDNSSKNNAIFLRDKNIILMGGSGCLGIGTETPKGHLHVSGNVIISNNSSLKLFDKSSIIMGSTGKIGFGVDYDEFQKMENVVLLLSGGKCLLEGEKGQIGIGTTELADRSKIHISGGNLIITGSGYGIGIGVQNPKGGIHIGNNGDLILTGENSNLVIESNKLYLGTPEKIESNTNLFISGGNVILMGESGCLGIGTETPKSKLNISGGNLILTGDSKIGIGTTNPSNSLHISGGNLILSDDSKIGIGTTNPSSSLHINDGNLILTGNSKIGIGTTNPTSSLSISGGNLNVDSGKIIIHNSGTLAICDSIPNDITNHIWTQSGSHTSIYSKGHVILQAENASGIVGSIKHMNPILSMMSSTSGDEWRWLISSDNWSNTDGRLYLTHNKPFDKSNNEKICGYFEPTVSNQINTSFTGQHRCMGVKEIYYYKNKIGYIVSSTGKYNSIFENTYKYGIEGIMINQSIPIVDLTNEVNDKKVFGVISGFEDPENKDSLNYYGNGNFVTQLYRNGDYRLYINSLGEGGIWVCNYNGNFTNGDFITSSPIEGIGMKQNADYIKNYTVGKITMDCNFIPARVFKKVLSTKYENNVLIPNIDENSNILYNDVNEYEYEYDCKEITYNNQTYKIAFVGCIYNCG